MSTRIAAFLFGLVSLVIVGSFFVFERPPIETSQSGFRGTGMEQVFNPRILATLVPNNTVPEAPEAADPEGPLASEVYENVQVLGHLSVEQFGRIMQAITEWIYPVDENRPEVTGCNGCHVPGNFAAEGVYSKVVARRMFQMTWAINTTWSAHVQNVGVTCWTCHRGNAVPANVWSMSPPVAPLSRFWDTSPFQNRPVPANGFSDLPADPFTPYLFRDEQIRVISDAARNRDVVNNQSLQQTEWTYSLMMHFSRSLGVNCTYCHNSRSFGSWETSPPARLTAWHGIRMVRNINNEYIEAIRDVFPPHRLGPLGDTLKVNCATCHQGVWQPMYGAQMLKDYPELNPPPPAQRAASNATTPAPVAVRN